jgi:LacI family transcriptional regulator
MENAIFARGIQAFQEELRTRGYTLLVASSSYRPEIEEEQIRTLVARGADGLLLIGHQRAESIYDFLEKQGVPALVAWAYRHDARVPAVGFDNEAAMRIIAELVIKKGHRRIGIISAPMQHNDRASARVEGIKAAAEAHGIPADSLQIVECPYGIETGAEALSELMGRPVRPTAVMCGNDVLAVGAVMRAREMGLSVPGDVSVTGFDDIDIARVAYPALTTMHVPHQEMGRKAAKLLLAMVLEHERPTSVLLETQIRTRDSLA